MNRIILIGNGFDLAHGLKSSYTDFLQSLWIKEVDMFNDFIKTTQTQYSSKFIKFRKGPSRANYIITKSTPYEMVKDLEIKGATIKNKFLRRITENENLRKWVDIEHEYFQTLLQISKHNTEYSINDLNLYFLDIKNELELYLYSETNNKFENIQINSNINNHLELNIQKNDFSINGKKELVSLFGEEIKKTMADKLVSEINHLELFSTLVNQGIIVTIHSHFAVLDESKFKNFIEDDLNFLRYYTAKPKSNLFLNFNYTNLEPKYFGWGINPRDSVFLSIHGKLKNEENQIIFGYGDEIAKEYKEIEDLNDNVFLENVKSIKYLNTENYNKLITFLDSDYYQVFIFGHSCGISDRTLLNTIFENEKCVSIKVFYHKWKDLNTGEENDNFSEVIRNISRNFNSKKTMREKVVNKTYSETLT